MMQTREIRLSQQGFARVQETLMLFESKGYGPEECAAAALRSIGAIPRIGVETAFIVDPALDGEGLPFTRRHS